MSTLRFVAPSTRHAPLVRGYWCVDDWGGIHVGKPIATGPAAGSVVTLNIGRPNAHANGPRGPQVSISGLYTTVHRWQSYPETCFIMVMLTAQGVASLFPGLGRDSVDRVLDLGELLGDPVALQLGMLFGREHVVKGQVDHIERWIDRRLDLSRSSSRVRELQSAVERLARGGSVDRVASASRISRRTLYKWTTENLGIGPKALSSLARLERSIAAVQRGKGDPIDGYSDQAHQIRDWQRRLCRTPLCYRTHEQSELAIKFRRAAADDLHSGALYL